MIQDLINRYQPGGDIYASLLALYGSAGADSIAAAALSGDESQINAALTAVKYGAAKDTSTLDAFGNQLATNPLGAPIDSINTVLSNSFLAVLKNPAVLFSIGLVIFLWLGGASFLRGMLTKK
jgi:hypothetical protein